jgi:hypothetical protein
MAGTQDSQLSKHTSIKEPEARHQCLIYDGAPSQKLPMIAAIIQSRLKEGYRCLYLNSTPMVSGIRYALSAMGTDVVSEIARGSLVLSSEPVTTNGEFNVDIMLRQLEDSLDQALSDGYIGLWASGDMTWEFGAKQDFSKLLEYELKLEEMFVRRSELCGICQYHKDTLPADAVRQSLVLHPGIVINETLSRVNPHYLKTSLPLDVNTSNQLDEMITLLCST